MLISSKDMGKEMETGEGKVSDSKEMNKGETFGSVNVNSNVPLLGCSLSRSLGAQRRTFSFWSSQSSDDPVTGFWGSLPGAHCISGLRPQADGFLCTQLCVSALTFVLLLIVCSCVLRGALFPGHLLPECLRTTWIYLQVC